MSEPLVSVVVTTFNQGAYIAETLQSALAQTYSHREIIVVDDGSTDGTPSITDSFGSRVTHIRQGNEGIARARNRGIRAATGSLVAFLDGDDRWHPEKLRRQVDAFVSFPTSGLIVSDGRQMDGDRVLTHTVFEPRVPRPVGGGRIASGECFKELLLGNLVASMSQAMIPRPVLADVGEADPDFQVASFYDVFLRIASKYPLTFIHDVLVDWRYLPTSASGPQEMRPFRWSEDTIPILRKHLRAASPSNRPLVRAALHQRRRQIARLAYHRGNEADRSWALAYLWRLWRRSGGDPVVATYLIGLLTPQRVRSTVASTLRKIMRSQ